MEQKEVITMDGIFAIATLCACSILVITGGLLHARACIMEAKTHELLRSIVALLIKEYGKVSPTAPEGV